MCLWRGGRWGRWLLKLVVRKTEKNRDRLPISAPRKLGLIGLNEIGSQYLFFYSSVPLWSGLVGASDSAPVR